MQITASVVRLSMTIVQGILFPNGVEVIDNGNGTFTIHLYEIVNNGDGTYHTATSAWYTVDARGIGTDDIYGDAIDLAE